MRTNILRHVQGSTAHQTKSLGQGAATQCYVATNPALATVSGEYFRDAIRPIRAIRQRDSAMAAKLWKVSEQLTARYLTTPQSGR